MALSKIRRNIFQNVSDKLEGMDMVKSLGGLKALEFDDIAITYILDRDSSGLVIEPMRLKSTLSIAKVERIQTHIVMELKNYE